MPAARLNWGSSSSRCSASTVIIRTGTTHGYDASTAATATPSPIPATTTTWLVKSPAASCTDVRAERTIAPTTSPKLISHQTAAAPRTTARETQPVGSRGASASPPARSSPAAAALASTKVADEKAFRWATDGRIARSHAYP